MAILKRTVEVLGPRRRLAPALPLDSYLEKEDGMKRIAFVLSAVLLSGCSTLPDTMYSASPDKIRSSSNFELCRAALDPDARRGGAQSSTRVIDGQMSFRGLDRAACFDVLLSEHGSSTMCSRYQRAVARGEPTALVGFSTNLSRQDIERGFARNNLSCSTSSLGHINTESGWSAIGRQVDRLNDNMSDVNQGNSTTDCYRVYDGKIRCRQY